MSQTDRQTDREFRIRVKFIGTAAATTEQNRMIELANIEVKSDSVIAYSCTIAESDFRTDRTEVILYL